MYSVKLLSERDFQETGLKAFKNVFKSNDPFGEPFVGSIKNRAILYPVDYELETNEIEAVIGAARAVGDTAFYLSVMERPNEEDQDRPYHWLFPFEEVKAYHSLEYPFVLENAIYSPNGLWGVMISHEQHAVVGGNEVFVKTLFSSLKVSEKQQLEEFLSVWKDNKERFKSDISWLPKLLFHVYGKENARKLLKNAGLG